MTHTSRQTTFFVLLTLALATFLYVSDFESHRPTRDAVTLSKKEPPSTALPVNDFVDASPWTSDTLCERDDIIKGRWMPRKYERPPYVTSTVHLRCYPSSAYKGEWSTYQWIPENDVRRNGNCEFTRWSASQFCSIAEGMQVLIIGDSLSWEQYSSLVQLLGVHPHQSMQFQSKELATNIGLAVCDGRTRIVYRRDDRLDNVSAALQWPGDDGAFFPTAVIMNRGAHYAADDIFLPNIERNLEHVRDWLEQCDRYGIRCHFFWRTTVPGHPNCGNFTAPINDLSTMERLVAEHDYDNRTLQYHWYDFQHQNQLVEAALNASELDYRVIDGYYLNVLRPDEHRAHQNDCLHSCYPGKMDVYNQLLLHYLQKDRTLADVERLRGVNAHQRWRTHIDTVYLPEETKRAMNARQGGN